jgi:hypothetical protein
VKERQFLMGKDGINGPDIDQLRNETAATVNGAGHSHFEDPAFVKAGKDMHEAKILAEGGFKGSQWASMAQRYERAEKELFARIEGLGREIENRVPATTATVSKTKTSKQKARRLPTAAPNTSKSNLHAYHLVVEPAVPRHRRSTGGSPR